MKQRSRITAMLMSIVLTAGSMCTPVWGAPVNGAAENASTAEKSADACADATSLLKDDSTATEMIIGANNSVEPSSAENHLTGAAPSEDQLTGAASTENQSEAASPAEVDASEKTEVTAPAEEGTAEEAEVTAPADENTAEATEVPAPAEMDTAEEAEISVGAAETQLEATPTEGVWNDFTWSLAANGTRLVVTGSGEMPDCTDAPWHNPEIRDKITEIRTGNYITSIGANAFANFPNLRTLKIGLRFATIGAHAFENCEELRTIYNTSTKLKTICERAFAGCENLNEPVFAETLTTIEKQAFADCIGIRRVLIPEELKTIGDEAFVNDVGINHVKIPESVTDVGTNIFKNCDGPMTAEIESYIIGEGMFRDCSGLSSVTIGKYVVAIGMHAFENCISLKSIDIPGRINVIGDSAFEGCRELATVNFATGLTTICTRAFYGSGLESLKFPESLTTLGSYAFSMCESLKSVDMTGCMLTALSNYAFAKDLSLVNVTLGKELRSIGQYAFDHCTSIETITLPEKLETIGKNAFSYASALRTVAATEAVTEIGDSAFYYCQNLESVTLGQRLKKIGANAFAFCLDLASLTVYSKNVAYTGKYVFRNTQVTLYGYKGSTTETYAKTYNVPFIVITGLQAPTITTCISARTGVSLKWSAVTNAVTYTVYRSTEEDGTYTQVNATNTRAFLDTGTETGTTYYYYVVADDGIMTSENSEKGVVTFVAAPKSVTHNNSLNGSQISWAPVANAEKYVIYRKADGNYEKIATINAPADTSKTIYYTDGTAAKGIIYTYGVASQVKDIIGIKRESRAYMRLITPTVSSVTSEAKGEVTVKWGKLDQARGYQVRITKDPAFKTDVQTITVGGMNSVSKTVTGLESGKTYYVRVLCYQKTDRYYYSGNSLKKSIVVK